MRLRATDIPFVPEDLYRDKVDSYCYFYNPLSTKGVIVLNEEAAFVFDLIDGKRSITSILEIIQAGNPDVTLDDLLPVIESFLDSQIILIRDSEFGFRTPRDRSDLSDGKLLRVWFHITNQCNLRCVYCFVPTTPEKMPLPLALRTISRIVLEAKQRGYTEIVCNFGGGEPLLAFDNLVKIVDLGKREAKKNGLKLRFGVITNGTLITPEVARVLKREEMFVAVSLDGLQPFQDLQRPLASGKGSFALVERGMNILRREGVSYNCIAVITNRNIEHLPELTKYSMETDTPFIYGFYKHNPNSSEDMSADPEVIIRYFRLALDEMYKNPPRHTVLHGLLDMVVLDYPHIYPCRAGRHYLVVRHDGKIASCPVSIERTIGSVEDENCLLDVVKDGSFLVPKTRSIEDIRECQSCPWKYACCGGCPLTTAHYKGSYSSNSPLCTVFKTLIPELLRVEARRLIVHSDF